MTVDGIRVVRAFIRRRPTKAYLRKHELNEVKYYEYHYASFLHRVHTIVEVMKLVANYAFSINLSARDCKWENLKVSEDFANSTMRRVIDSCYVKLNVHIQLRHLSTHRGNIQNTAMGSLDAELSARDRWTDPAELSKQPEEIQRYFHPVHVRHRVELFKKDLLKEIDDTEQVVLGHLRRFLRSLKQTERFPR